MTVFDYNKHFYPVYNKALSFLGNLNNALSKCDDNAATNKTCQLESDHEWECIGMSTVGTDYMCRKCYARKTVPNVDQKYFSVTEQN